ncbi:MAG: PAS domain-containing sensor histidine kinase [Beijerinckiaceae bacterium]
MSYFSAISASAAERFSALVHDSAGRDRASSARHLTFIAARLLISLAALVCMPAYLALYGAPAPVEVLVFTLAMGPLAAAVLVSRTGNILAGHIVCIACAISISVIATLWSGSLSSAAVVWLALAPLEAFLSGSAAMVIVTGAAAFAAAALAVALRMSGLLGDTTPGSEVAAGLALLLAISYATVLAFGAVRGEEIRNRFAAMRHIRFRSLSEAIGDMVLRMDRTGAVAFVSDNSERIFGLSGQEFSGRGLFERVHVADRPAFLKAVSDAAGGDSVVTALLRIRAPGASEESTGVQFRWIELRVNKLRYPDEQGSAVVAVARDVTNVKLHQEELEAARRDAEQANIWKDRFLANVSHELRTPLNAIIGFAEILSTEAIAPKDPAKSREYAQIIHESGEHLLSVVNSILDISKIEAGSFDIVPEGFEMEPMINNCIDMLHLRAMSGGVDLKTEIAPAIGEIVADKRALKQIVINLLSNAIKFTPEGGKVTIGIRPEGNSAILWVRDTGIGIFESELQRVGDPFFQAADNYNRTHEGTGLGLSVVRGLVGLHGGAIRIESAPGAGTCVTVKLPMDCRSGKSQIRTSAKIEAIPLRQAVESARREEFEAEVLKIA